MEIALKLLHSVFPTRQVAKALVKAQIKLEGKRYLLIPEAHTGILF